ncbi:T9SS type A sorting domain-containing protein [Fibrobacter sp.]|uniref:T9SS type A sorting domain-containing protein n=1 Tax=Fibrobacter sp. TaxID=35828 RepID=UPI003870B8D7
MKKLMTLVFALFLATNAFAEEYEASQKITQELLAGSLTQTVYAGDEIQLIKIKYDNIDESKHQSGNISDLGLSEKWTGSVCEISGKINGNIAAQTVKAYILVQDDEGKYAQTDLSFEVLEKPFKFEWNNGYGRMDQTVKIGYSITPILFDYDAIEEYKVSGLPSGLISEIDKKNHHIIVAGNVEESVESGDYEYTVTVKDYNSKEHTLSGTITVKSLTNVTSIKVVENEKQKVKAGNAIKPVVFKFEYAQDIEIKDIPPGHFGGASEEDGSFVVEGTVAENTKDGNYTIKVIAKGEQNNDTAFATVEVTHKSVETTLSVIENETQTVVAGDSIEPIVFKFENAVDIGELTGFPGGYKIIPDNATKSIYVIGKVNEGAKGPYTVKLSILGDDNNASAEATINVTPLEMKFELVEGSDNQTVVAGNAITPIVYKYDHMLSVKGSGFPSDLKVDLDKKNNLITISGTVSSESAAYEYVYSFAVTDLHGEVSTVTGKINVVRESNSSSSAVASSSSAGSSSSSVASSSSAKSSSSSAKSSSSVEVSSSSVAASSSSVKPSSSSAKSSDSKSSSSSAKAQSSSSGKKVESSSSSAKSDKSSSSEKSIKIVAVAMNNVKFGYANNALTVALPTSSMVRVQVFDLTGHLVESFAESVNGSRIFSLAHLNRGNYLVRVESNSFARTARIAVK